MTEPYKSGPGSQPVDTSQERESWLVESGLSASRQEQVFALLASRESKGMTGRELRESSDAPENLKEYANGTSVLTGLYKLGRASKLSERRGGGRVYVAHGFENDRPTTPYVPSHVRRFTQDELNLVDSLIEKYESRDTRSRTESLLLGLLKKIYTTT